MVKRFLALTCVFSILLCGCNNSDTSSQSANDSTQVTAEQEVTSPPKAPTLDIIFEDLQIYEDALGHTCATYVAELKNTSETAVSIKDTSIDVEKPDGTLLTSTDFFSVYPRVVPAGENAFICKDIINGLDEGIAADQIGSALLHYDLESRSDTSPIEVELSELTLGMHYSQPKFMGRIKNIGTTDLSNIYVAAPIRDANGVLQAVGFTIVKTLAAGETKGFEQTCMSASTNLDYSNSTLTAFAYDGSLY